MAAIKDLIDQIEDSRLRERLSKEVDELTKNQRFGLTFERHLPELTPLYSAKPRRGELVCRKDGLLTDVWRVARIEGQLAHCLKPQTNEKRTFPVEQLLVVRQFGEPIFPSLVSMGRVENGPANQAWHTLIEADNYHALQLLEYIHAGEVDCIYIDPPYNTGARDWKYNNDYVDNNDSWRHSKWLAFMEKRLKLAKRLLNPSTGVLIVTIDEHEVHHLGMLTERLFPTASRQLATIVINQKGVSQGRLARTEEYAIFIFMPQAFLKTHYDDLLSPDRSNHKQFQMPRWERLLRGGTNSRREDRHLLFYPIYVDLQNKSIKGVGQPLPLDKDPDLDEGPEGSVAWPIRTDGSFGNWQVMPSSFMELVRKGYAKLGGYDKKRRTWTVLYLNRGTRARIDKGEIVIVGRDPKAGHVQLEYASAEARLLNIKTVWHRRIHDSGIYGSSLLKNILGSGAKFSFPKSLYSTKDAIAAVVRDKPQALIIDFFAGSGTTLNAINLLNATDEGKRRCILVTNNEVSGEEADALRNAGCQPGSDQWEKKGICRSVTWPRSKFTIVGSRDDGTALAGEYLTGRSAEKESERRFFHVGFLEPSGLNTVPKRKQFVSLIDSFPQTLVTEENSSFIVSAEHVTTILFEAEAAEKWLAALEEQSEIEKIYIVTRAKRTFDDLKQRVNELLGPLIVAEEEKRPMGAGFNANLEYFKLAFLDKDQVALKRRFREILPLLWLRAGAIGPRPELAKTAPEPPVYAPSKNSFAVLLDERRFTKLLEKIRERTDLTHVFIVTDDDDAFMEMASEISESLKNTVTVQLYRDYLENFMINKESPA